MIMDLGSEDLKKKRASITSRRTSSSLGSEEGGFKSIRDNLLPTGTGVISGEHYYRKTNLKTGLNISEQAMKNVFSIRSKDHVNIKKSSNKIGSARPLTSRGGQGDRLVLDARHFQGVIHLKMAELSEEIDRLHGECKAADQEYAHIPAYQIKAKELAEDVTHFQEMLADLNNAFDYINTVIDVSKIEFVAEELKQENISEKEKIEELFCERKAKGDFILRKEMDELVENKVNDTSDIKEKINILNSKLSQSSATILTWKKKIELYNEIRRTVIQDLQSQLPFPNEVCERKIDLFKLISNSKEMSKGSTSMKRDEQKELLEMVKENTKEISVMEHSISDINKKIKDIEEVTGNINFSRESEGRSEKDIDTYLKKFDDAKNERKSKIQDLEIQLTHVLNNLLEHFSCTDFISSDEGKLDLQDFPDGLETILEKHSMILKLCKKIESIHVSVTNKCKILEEKCSALKQDLEEYKTFKLETEFKERENELKNEILELKIEESKRLEDLEMAKSHHKILKEELSKNTKHKVILQLEEKHFELLQDNTFKKQEIEEMQKTTINLMKIKKETLNVIQEYTEQLISSNNGLYVAV